jgi:hypothetical protein
MVVCSPPLRRIRPRRLADHHRPGPAVQQLLDLIARADRGEPPRRPRDNSTANLTFRGLFGQNSPQAALGFLMLRG